MTARAGPLDASVRRAIAAGAPPSPRSVDALVAEHAGTLGDQGRAVAARGLLDRLVGLGPLAQLAADPSVTDLLVNGDGAVWVDRGHGVERDGRRVPLDDLRPLAVRLAGVAGRRLDDAQPWVDGVLPGGVRLHAVLPPLADGGRTSACGSPGTARAASTPWCGSVPSRRDLAALLREPWSRPGSPSSSPVAPAPARPPCWPPWWPSAAAHERIVVVEDVRELDPDHPHVVRLQGRGPQRRGCRRGHPGRPRAAGAADAARPARGR